MRLPDSLCWLFDQIDELYNHKTKLFLLSEFPLNELFVNIGNGETHEAFAIKRAISRLNEIQTLAYFNEPHVSGQTERIKLEI